MNLSEAISTKMRWLPYVIFAIATCIFFGAQLFGHAYFWSDFAEYVFPTRVFAASHISHFQLPFWNPYSFSGTPFLADLQTAVFYPPYLLLDFFSGGHPYPIGALQFVIILHFFLAQVSMYLLCRYLKISPLGAMIAAIGYGFSSPLTLHAFHPMQVFHLAWFPLIFKHFHEAITKRKLLSALLGGLLLGITMLSGSPQMSLYIVFFLGCAIVWFTIDALLKKTSTPAQSAISVGLGALGILIAIGLFCIQLFPSKEFASLSERNEISYETASSGSFSFKQLITAAVPKAFGDEYSPDDQEHQDTFFLNSTARNTSEYYLYWDTAFFFGITTLLLGILGAMNIWKASIGKFFLTMAVFGFLFALGSNGLLFRVFFYLPFFSSLRVPARMMCYVSFVFCLFAGFGFDELSRKLGDNTTRLQLIRAFLVPLIICIGILAGLLVDIPQEFKSSVQSHTTLMLVLLGMGITISFLLHRKIISSSIAGLLFIVVIFSDLFLANGTFNANKTNPIDDYNNNFSSPLRETLTAIPPSNIFRVLTRVGQINGVKRNQGMVDHIMMFEGYNQLLLSRRYPKIPSSARMKDVLNIKYEFKVDTAKKTADFYLRPNFFPNAWMVYAIIESNGGAIEQVMQDSNILYKDIAVTEEPLEYPLSNKPASIVNHAVTCTFYDDNAITYSTSSTHTALLCTSEIFYPAWKAYIDGNEAPIHRINYCFRGVEVPAGNHTVEMKYQSATFAMGSRISIGTLLITIGAIGLIKKKEKKEVPKKKENE